jgi:hypothetical protein
MVLNKYSMRQKVFLLEKILFHSVACFFYCFFIYKRNKAIKRLPLQAAHACACEELKVGGEGSGRAVHCRRRT